jgi:hypothetical protein
MITEYTIDANDDILEIIYTAPFVSIEMTRQSDARFSDRQDTFHSRIMGYTENAAEEVGKTIIMLVQESAVLDK